MYGLQTGSLCDCGLSVVPFKGSVDGTTSLLVVDDGGALSARLCDHNCSFSAMAGGGGDDVVVVVPCEFAADVAVVVPCKWTWIWFWLTE